MEKIKFYCVTNKLINFLDFKGYNLAWVGKDNPPSNYLKCNYRDNIFHKEKIIQSLLFIIGIGKIYYLMKEKINGLDFVKKEDIG